MTPMSAFFANLDPVWRAVASVVSLLTLGIAMGAVSAGFTGLPATVEANTQVGTSNTLAIAANFHLIEESKEGIDKVLCILSLPEGVSHVEGLERCGI